MKMFNALVMNCSMRFMVKGDEKNKFKLMHMVPLLPVVNIDAVNDFASMEVGEEKLIESRNNEYRLEPLLVRRVK